MTTKPFTRVAYKQYYFSVEEVLEALKEKYPELKSAYDIILSDNYNHEQVVVTTEL